MSILTYLKYTFKYFKEVIFKSECKHEWVKGSFIRTYCAKCGINESDLNKTNSETKM